MVVVGVLGTRFGGDYNDNFELPDTESTTAQDLLAKLSGGAGTGAGLEGQVVWKPDSGKATDAAGEAAMTRLLTDDVHVARGRLRAHAVRRAARDSACPRSRRARASRAMAQGEQQGQQHAAVTGGARARMAHFGQAGVSPDGTVAYATVTFEGETFDDLDTDDVTTRSNPSRRRTATDGLQVGANGVFAFVGGEPPSSESIGVTVALVILLFAFGSLAGRVPADRLGRRVGRAHDRLRAAAGGALSSTWRRSRRSWRR